MVHGRKIIAQRWPGTGPTVVDMETWDAIGAAPPSHRPVRTCAGSRTANLWRELKQASSKHPEFGSFDSEPEQTISWRSPAVGTNTFIFNCICAQMRRFRVVSQHLVSLKNAAHQVDTAVHAVFVFETCCPDCEAGSDNLDEHICPHSSYSLRPLLPLHSSHEPTAQSFSFIHRFCTLTSAAALMHCGSGNMFDYTFGVMVFSL